MTSKLVLMGCGALMALTQAAHGADAEALSRFLNERASEDGEWTITALPCALTVEERDPVDWSDDEVDVRTLVTNIHYSLDVVDLNSAETRRHAALEKGYFSADWISPHKENIRPLLFAVERKLISYHDRPDETLPQAEGYAIYKKISERLIMELKAGEFGPDAARNYQTIKYLGPYGAHVFTQLEIAYPFMLSVKPGTEQAVLDALIEWRAETCTGG